MHKWGVISADSHILIKDDALVSHLEKQWRDPVKEIFDARVKAMRENGSRLYEKPKWAAAGRAGEWDPRERLKDMDTDMVDAEVLYSTPDGGGRYYQLPREGCVKAIQAFNDAALDFTSADRKRLLAVHLVPITDPETAVTEVKRLTAAGVKAIMIPAQPLDLGLKPYWDRSWDPLWATMEETGLPVSQHLSGNSAVQRLMQHDPTPNYGIFRALAQIVLTEQVASWCMSGVLHRFPRLKLVMVEAGLGWIPYMLERMDYTVNKLQWTHDVLPEKPSYYWHQSMAATFEEDEFGVKNRHDIGIDSLMWASDYPHPDSTWPDSHASIKKQFAGVPADEVKKMTYENVARFYHLN